jgi:hypothetical protein
VSILEIDLPEEELKNVRIDNNCTIVQETSLWEGVTEWNTKEYGKKCGSVIYNNCQRIEKQKFDEWESGIAKEQVCYEGDTAMCGIPLKYVSLCLDEKYEKKIPLD